MILTIISILLVFLLFLEFSRPSEIKREDLADQYRYLLESKDGLDPRDALFSKSESWEAHYIVNSLLIR